MLTIKKNSWHFRLWRFGRESADPKPHNLCKYFWHIAIVKVLIPFTLACLVLTGVGALVWVIWGHPMETAGVVSGAVFCILLAVTAGKLIAKAVERRRAKQVFHAWSVPEEKKEPGVIRAFLKARKQKMCPLIEVVDE